jgi:hypothetical protein
MEECNKRYKERPELMMSRGYPETIEGRDIFDPSPEVNPDYWDYNMVLIPYCTSDLWVGNSSWIPTNTSRFNFSSSATHNQFAFRGSVVFRSVVLELLYKGMNLAKDVVLVGSSAGGIGAMNQAGWLKSRLSGNMTLSVILDSAWFINFHGNLQGKFDFDYVSMSMNILSHIPCQDFSIGYPCCISAPCMLRKSPQTTLDFPNIPVFVIFSQYDLFILSRALENLENETDDVRTLEWFRTIAMYGEVMKVRLNDTRVTSKNMSYFVPSCLQHVYLATSDLRESGGFLRADENLTDRDIEFSSDTKSFRSAIEPGKWSKTSISNKNGSSVVTLQCAINEWNRYIRKGLYYTVRYSDECFGATCNPKCPETITLGVLGELWSTTFKWVVVGVTLALTVLCLLYKIILMHKKTVLLNGYRKFICQDQVSNQKMSLYLDGEAIGIACLDLRYSVRLSHDAVRRAREVEKWRFAAEEEARNFLGYFTLDNTKMEFSSSTCKQLSGLFK